MSRERQDALEAFAASLAEAWRTGAKIALPDPRDRPKDRSEAYLVQDRMAALIGAPVIGWKAGATSDGSPASFHAATPVDPAPDAPGGAGSRPAAAPAASSQATSSCGPSPHSDRDGGATVGSEG